MSLNFKRHRAPSQTSTSSPPSSPENHPPNKASRTVPRLESATDGTGIVAHPLLCTLPPTCNHRPTPIANTRDLEAHYAMYHAHVCEQPGCGSVFPDARLLELHQTECHDPLAAVRKDRGEKIFGCHLPSCTKLFLTPKTRRLHLIQAHGYPKEYFFAVTNKGVGGLLKRWGEGASMIRGEWKPRDDEIKDADQASDSEDSEDQDHTPGATKYTELITDDEPEQEHRNDKHASDGDDTLMDGLANTMGSLTLVPPSIRFGRGGKNGGFVHNTRGGGSANSARGVPAGDTRGGGRARGRGRGGRGAPHPVQPGGEVFPHQSSMDVDPVPSTQVPARARGGLGWAGRGRAGIVHIPARGRGALAGRGARGRGGAIGVGGPERAAS